MKLDELRKQLAGEEPVESESVPDLGLPIKFPNVKVELVGMNGNAFFIMGRVTKALKKAGATSKEIEEYKAEAKSGDYDHLLQTTMLWVDVY